MNQTTCQILLDRCYDLAKLSNCRKRQFGAVIVPTEVISSVYLDRIKLLDEILAQGVNHTYDWELCDPCLRADIPSGTRAELCRAVHAEQAAILNYFAQNKGDLSECTMLVNGRKGDERLVRIFIGFYCTLCSRLMAAAGLDGVVILTADGPAFLSMAATLDSSFRAVMRLANIDTEGSVGHTI